MSKVEQILLITHILLRETLTKSLLTGRSTNNINMLQCFFVSIIIYYTLITVAGGGRLRFEALCRLAAGRHGLV